MSKSKAPRAPKGTKKRATPAKKPAQQALALLPDPALPLLNPRLEALVQARVGGMDWAPAMRAAGYKSASNAPRLAARPEVAARLRWLQERNAQAVAVTREDLMRWLMEQILWDPLQLMEDTPSGMSLRAMKDIPESIRRMVSGIEVDQVFQGEDNPPITRTKLKLIDRQKALDMLARMIGAYEADNRQLRERPAIMLIPDQIDDPIKWAEAVVVDQHTNHNKGARND
jgi:hypothetical protein